MPSEKPAWSKLVLLLFTCIQLIPSGTEALQQTLPAECSDENQRKGKECHSHPCGFSYFTVAHVLNPWRLFLNQNISLF